MGTEIYVQGYRNRRPAGLGADRVRAILGVCGPGPLYRLAYDDAHHCELSLTGRTGLATSFAILRPCDHPALWLALFAVLTEGPYVLFAPDGNAPVAAGQTPDLPSGMADALGAPVIVDTPGAIRPALFG
ncbi:hypothetical protein GE300_04790 [Rhodobacteraceae bacterium 2CG4]|uniref:Uncharacterized protein n=1 Tax=Halovulum marinum TaxID=2662447 RepID=A0A6L5YYF3_9RHOB|nr:hypothetical protein [Halovulum marinum]MSU88940.1 hypothetical protein [Halovulum marinum]